MHIYLSRIEMKSNIFIRIKERSAVMTTKHFVQLFSQHLHVYTLLIDC